ncbi:hypothetical protein M422DRAFT_266856 [Sphaerobolus stellatus SS14]|uniref:FAD-binding domain-containing protein n=1 Tax=Sphaerobolus stellatus (strain SS14) TaxID=990650 RepID=A0A0C9TNA2_SPHS4|nr:hypothetical protein M422DRAFT_266856 [Sphaerobolus stellatus SS14]
MGSKKDFKVSVVGGGIGGLVLAVGLARRGIEFNIFEQAKKFEEIGAGVGVGPNAVKVLRDFGILDEIIKVVNQPLTTKTFVVISGLPGHETIYEYPGLQSDAGLAVHRALFLDTVVKLLPPGIAHFNKRCVSIEEGPESVNIHFEDGTQHTSDIVIGCDGIRSVVRRAVLGRVVVAKFTRTVAFRGLIPVDSAIEALGPRIAVKPHAFVGPDRHLIVFPLQGQPIVNIVVFATDRSKPWDEQGPQPGESWVLPATQEEMLGYFEGWDPRVTKLLSFITKPNKWFLHALSPPLETYVKGRIALLGDAAHSMLPHMGAGAGQAMEDGYVFSALLSHSAVNKNNLEDVLKAYDHVRRPRANRVLEESYVAGEVYELAGPSGPNLHEVRNDLTNKYDFVWHHDLNQDVRTAFSILGFEGKEES